MTIDEAIEYEENIAEMNFNKAILPKDHRQIAEWLKDYKRLLEKVINNECNNN